MSKYSLVLAPSKIAFWLHLSVIVLIGVSPWLWRPDIMAFQSSVQLLIFCACTGYALRLAMADSDPNIGLQIGEDGECAITRNGQVETMRVGNQGVISRLCVWLPLLPLQGNKPIRWKLVFRDQCNHVGFCRLCRAIRQHRQNRNIGTP